LERLRLPGEQDAWTRFVQLYTPLLLEWARRLGLQSQDAADLVQEVYTILVQKLPQFCYDKDKGFRKWLRTVIHNKWRERARRRQPAARGGQESALADLPAPEEPDALSEAEYCQQLIRRALHLMQTEFSASTWKACWEHVMVGRPAAEVAAELGICVGAVYVAKSRVLCRLRQELAGLLE
jgi:RNA polymerase sigma-70 factor (ECF subfamily)